MKIDQQEAKGVTQGKIEFNPGQESYRCLACNLSIKSGDHVRYANGDLHHRSCAVKLGMFDKELRRTEEQMTEDRRLKTVVIEKKTPIPPVGIRDRKPRPPKKKK